MFLLDAPSGAGDRLREAWGGLGESIVVVGGSGEWNCHIHTDDVGAAIEAGVGIGRPHRIVVVDLHEQAAKAEFEAGFVPLPAFAGAPVGVVAVGIGDGVAALFREAGAQAMVSGGQTMNPPVGTLLDAVESVPSSIVVVLPNNRNVVPAAEQIDGLTRKQVHVVPTTTVVQGLAAMLAYLPGDDPARVVAAMEDAAAGCRSGEITQAVRAATTPLGVIGAGDWLGLIEGKVEVVADDVAGALVAVAEVITEPDAEMVTIITGEGADAGAIAAVEGWLAVNRPHVEIEIHRGGQPLYPYFIGAE
jgi:dihydroxyacetone kinase-like predicted kinase